MDDAGAFIRGDVFPGNDPVGGPSRLREGRRRDRGRRDQARSFPGISARIAGSPLIAVLSASLATISSSSPCWTTHIRQFRMDRRGHVGDQGPGRRGPDDERAILGSIDERETDVDRKMGPILVALGDDLVLGDTGAAAWAPGHDIVPLVDPAALMAGLQEMPDRVVVFVRHRVVGVVPVHPVAEPDRLVGDPFRVFPDSFLAAIDKLGDAIRFDIAFALETEFLFDFDLDPEALAVKPVLEALLLAEHGVIALEEILVGSAPGVVDTHRVVGGDGTIDERELGL